MSNITPIFVVDNWKITKNKFIMKANLFTHSGQFEILLANGHTLTPETGQTKEEFIESTSMYVIDEYVEKLELKEVDISAIKKVGSKQLEKRLEHATGLAKEMIEEVLTLRGKLEPEVEEVEIDAEEIAKRAELIAKIEAERLAKLAEEEKPKIKILKAKHLQEVTLEQVFEMADQVRDDKGKRCRFKGFRSDVWEEGTINGIWIDKRVPMAMYRIKLDDPTKKMKNKKITSEDIEIL